MKKLLLTSLSILALTTFASAETTITLSGVHNCCKGCANGISKAADGIKDTTVAVEGETVTITAKNKSNAKKAAEAIADAGYYGTSSEDSASTMATKPSTKTLKGTTTVSGVHLCCGKCVKAVEEAVTSVKGVTGSKIEEKQKSFTVDGEFAEADLAAALNKAGFAGKIK